MALIPDPRCCPCGDAVLGVEDVVRARGLPQRVSQSVDGGEAPLLERRQPRWRGNDRVGNGDVGEPARVRVAERHDLDVLANLLEGLGEAERVHDAASWTG